MLSPVERRAAAQSVGYSVAIGVDRLERRRIRTLHELAEELVGAGAEIVGKANVFDVGSVDEDDLRLDADLRRANVEAADVLQHVGEARRRLGDDERVGGAVSGNESACDAALSTVANDGDGVGNGIVLRAILLQQLLNGRNELSDARA